MYYKLITTQKLKQMKTVSQQVKEFGAKVTKKARGWYTYNGVNFTVDIIEEACETKWWEVDLYGSQEVHPSVLNEVQDNNNFETKGDLVHLLLLIDKELTK